MTMIELVYAQKLDEGMLLDTVTQAIEVTIFMGMRITHKNKKYVVREMGDKLILIEDN